VVKNFFGQRYVERAKGLNETAYGSIHIIKRKRRIMKRWK